MVSTDLLPQVLGAVGPAGRSAARASSLGSLPLPFFCLTSPSSTAEFGVWVWGPLSMLILAPWGQGFTNLDYFFSTVAMLDFFSVCRGLLCVCANQVIINPFGVSSYTVDKGLVRITIITRVRFSKLHTCDRFVVPIGCFSALFFGLPHARLKL